MRDNNDDLHDIPPMVPSRDEMVTRQRRRNQPEIVTPASYAEFVKVSTWPVRIMLFLLTAAIGAAAYGGYLFHERYINDLRQADRRIADLENRLALVGDSAEETTANVIERVDFNFSEIDKLWAARRATNQSIVDLTGRVTVAETAVKENKDGVEMTAQLITQSTNLLEQTRREVADMRGTVQNHTTSIAALNTTVQNLQTVAQEMVNLRATLISAQDLSGGLNERVAKVEEAIEAIDAYRLQINQTVMRLQQTIEEARAR
jgi:methyl-accepting chemotaxis protein